MIPSSGSEGRRGDLEEYQTAEEGGCRRGEPRVGRAGCVRVKGSEREWQELKRS